MTVIKLLHSDEEDEIRRHVGGWHLHGWHFWSFAERSAEPADPDAQGILSRFAPRRMTVWIVNEDENLKWLTATVTVESARITHWQTESGLARHVPLLQSTHWQQALQAAFLDASVFRPRQCEAFGQS